MQQKHETCPKTIKQWWHETYILPSELSKLMTPKTCSLSPRTFSLHSAPPKNNKTIMENKAYNLPDGVIKLMTPRTCSVHTKKQSFVER